MQEDVSIIIVDDQKSYRDGLASLLMDFNITTKGYAGNGLQFFDLFKITKSDVVLIDIEMPEMDGGETLDRLRKDYPDIKAIMISGYDDETLIQDLFKRGASAYIPKDTDAEIIAHAIRVVKAKGIYKDNLAELEKKRIANAKREHYKSILPKREREIISLLCKGKKVCEMATALDIAEKTVESNLTEIYKKFGVGCRSEFLIFAMKEGLNFLGTSDYT